MFRQSSNFNTLSNLEILFEISSSYLDSFSYLFLKKINKSNKNLNDKKSEMKKMDVTMTKKSEMNKWMLKKKKKRMKTILDVKMTKS